jgi:glutamate synthase (NADPH/NADH) small chain
LAALSKGIVDMGKPTGFLEFPRELPLAVAPAERIGNWQEFHEHAEEQLLLKQIVRGL